MKKKTCSIEWCSNNSYAKTYCASHYRRFRRYGDPSAGGAYRSEPGLPCAIEGCDRSREKRDWCNTHYQRWRRHGSTDDGAMRFDTPEDSFAHRTERRGDCLIWTGYTDDQGYGWISVEGRAESVHRYAWERQNGPADEDMVIDHQDHCDHACVEVEHLRLATRAENSRNRAGASPNNRSTGIRGVYPDREGRGYYVRVGGRYRGYSKTLDGATEIAERVRSELYGEFAGKGGRSAA